MVTVLRRLFFCATIIIETSRDPLTNGTCKVMHNPEQLRDFPLLASLDAPTLRDLGRRMQISAYRAGQQIVTEGEPASGLFFILAGRVRLAREAADGRVQVLATVGPGEHFDLVPLFDGGHNPASAHAMSRVECLHLAREDLLALIARHPDLAQAALSAMAAQLRELVDLVEDLAFRSVRARLARHLLSVAADGTAALTHQELAERTGTIREIAGRALRRMAEEGLVRLQRGQVQVLDRERLARTVSE